MATTATQQLASAPPPSGAANGTVNATDDQVGIWDLETADKVRRQVEYYFSDENLPGDFHLLQYCGGSKNNPVSINRICGFKKMRIYKPKRNVALVLRQSAFLEVSNDGKTVKRKVPLQGLCALDEKFYDETHIFYDPRTGKPKSKPPKPAQFTLSALPQTNPNFPKGTTKNMMKPTGFEKTFTEPLLTPVEAAAAQAAYDQENPLDERIQFAVQRFKEKRRMHEMYAHVFNKLMRFGGMESSLRVGQGYSNKELAEMKDKEERTKLTVTHYLPKDYADEKKWVVDFASIARSFLSWYPAHYGYAPDAIKNACQVPRSFYNFLRYHNVCPEYDQQLIEALEICDIAEQELPKVYEVGLALPGDFNKSASALFGGAHAGLYAGDKSWAEDMKKEGIHIDQIGIRIEEARIKFGTGLALMGSDEQSACLDSLHLETLDISSASLQVAGIELPSEDLKILYKEQSAISDHKVGGRIEPLGKLICKPWHAEDCDEWDLPKYKCPNGRPQQADTDHVREFWVEQSILEKCFVGLKIEGKVLTLEGGTTILDEVHETVCSFFTWLPNELWMYGKPTEVVWLPKGLAEDVEDPTAAVVQEGPEASPREDQENAKDEPQTQGWDYGWDEDEDAGQGQGQNRGDSEDEGGEEFLEDEMSTTHE